jgi:septum site-determining protein MinC
MSQAQQGTQQGRAASKIADVFELKSASLSLLSLVLKSADLAVLAAALHERLGDTPDVFNHEPLLIDLSQLPRSSPPPEPSADAASAPTQLELGETPVALEALDLAALLALLRGYNMQPVALLGATAAELALALSLGLAEAPEPDQPVQTAAQPQIQRVVKEVLREVEVVREVLVPAEAAKTMIIDKPLRSGQQVYAKGGDLVVLALVNHGAEVIADGSIHVYAPLRGKAIAGAKGNTEARIFATSMEAELIAIAGTYRTTENPLPDTVFGKPAQIRLEGEKLVMEPLKF